MKIRYDISTREDAVKTLSIITGKSYDKCKNFFQYTFSESNLKKYFSLFISDCIECLKIPIDKIEFVASHITTSDDECNIIKTNGLLSNYKVYEIENSQLRRYFDKYNIYLDLKRKSIKYKGYEKFFDDSEHELNNLYINQALNQFFYDYAVCGFQCINFEYSCIKYCPELICKISKHFDLNMKNEWIEKSKTFIVKFIVENEMLIRGFYKNDIYDLLFEAFTIANKESECILITKNNIEILPSNIVKVIQYN